MSVPTGSNYPTGLDGDTFFGGDVINQAEFTLSVDISDSVTAFVVDESIGDVNVPVFLIFATGEIVYAEAKDGVARQFSLVTRGAGGTSPAPHTAGEVVRLTLVAEILNFLKWAMVNIEAELGLSPSGSFATVKARLDSHTHAGGDNGVILPVSSLSNHNKTVHDALLIDADTLDGNEAAAFAVAAHVHALGDLSNVTATAEGSGGGLDADTVDGIEGALMRDTIKAVSGGALVLASNTITVDGDSFYTIAPEGAFSEDNLDIISGGSAGDIVILCLDLFTDTIVLRNGVNNIYCPHGQDFYLTGDNPQIALRKDNAGNWRVAQWANNIGAIEIAFGNGIDAIEAGDEHTLEVPFDCEVVEWTIVGDQAGSISIDIWHRDYTAGKPTDTYTITGGAEPGVTSADRARSSALAAWDIDLARGYLLTFYVDSADTMTEALLSLKVIKK